MKKIIIIVCSLFYQIGFSEIEITTIDAYRIINAGPDLLLVTKFSENQNSNNGFLFQMSRPYCLCESPTFVLYSPLKDSFIRPKEDTTITGKISVDLGKPKEVSLDVFIAREGREQNVLHLKGNFPSLRKARLIEIETIYGKDKFILKGLENAMKQATKICETFIPYQEQKAEAEEIKV